MDINKALKIVEANERKREKARAASRAYYQAHKEECSERARNWRKENSAKTKEYQRAYRARQKAELEAAKRALSKAVRHA